ncbi:hemerythrin domain-containing protein [Anaeromyxobacter dehalogenans]|uniref:Hemerythrin-like domain-containing protein n=1 Tax=Anaeromyxobacter dehalogenans (strain 2CP-C) TaxID=290397 RepID=Q2IN38_ANADE|nr:hemerythrin domain-containing protein [Anaeromyxobacter dehalogenans]ABC80221.1 hypothetical protein Adeh_0445 [Anaeromyxobacter dehalogenans 2CP-C]
MTAQEAGPRDAGPISRFLSDDHLRLHGLLARAVADPAAIDRGPYDAFRGGLLRHIALEEKVLLPAAREAQGGEPLPLARRLRVEHGAIASLLVPTPTHALVAEIRKILDPHNLLEEAPDGLYATCDGLLAARADELVARMAAYPAVKVAAYNDGPRVLRTAEAALEQSAKQAEARSGPR